MARKRADLETMKAASRAENFVNAAHDAPKAKGNKTADKEFRLNVIIGAERSRALKILAAQRGQTVKELTLALIDKELAANG